MKIISLNTFGGRFLQPLLSFVAAEAPSTDVFCFQEVYSAPRPISCLLEPDSCATFLQELNKILPEFVCLFSPVQDGLELPQPLKGEWQYGLAVFVKKAITIKNQGTFFLCNGYNSFVPMDFATLGYNAQWLELNKAGRDITLFNVHGIAMPGHKRDTPVRLTQSQNIITVVSEHPTPTIICGDFNLLPDTASIHMIESVGLRNLITECGIKTTRGSLLKQLHPEYGASPLGFQEFADFVFVSKEVQVADFRVPDLPISDHLPLILTLT